MVFFRNEDEAEGVENPVEPEGERIIPLLPLRDIVVFPQMVVPLFVGRAKSIQALEDAVAGNRELLLAAQKQAGQDEPGSEDIHRIGTLGTIVQLLRLPDGTVKVLVEGKTRARLNQLHDRGEYFEAEVEAYDEAQGTDDDVQALMRAVQEQFENYVKLNRKIPPESVTTIAALTDVDLCVFPRGAFEKVLQRHARMEHLLLQRTLAALGEARSRMLSLARKSAEEKVAGFLIDMTVRMADASSRATPGGPVTFDLPLSRGQMADILGLTIETVSRQITKLRDAGVINLPGGRAITIADRPALIRRAEAA